MALELASCAAKRGDACDRTSPPPGGFCCEEGGRNGRIDCGGIARDVEDTPYPGFRFAPSRPSPKGPRGEGFPFTHSFFVASRPAGATRQRTPFGTSQVTRRC